MWWLFPLVACGSYLLGSIPVGLLVGQRLRGIDIREFGSGKTGFTNSLRTLGFGPSVLVLAGDLLKGVIAVQSVTLLFGRADLQVVAATGAVVGHVLPIFAGFKGGRGVMTSLGATLMMLPGVAIFVLLVGAVVAVSYRYMSLASIAGTAAGAIVVWAMALTGRVPPAYAAWGIIATVIILFCHRDNIRRLRDGTEPKIGRGGERRRTSPGSANP